MVFDKYECGIYQILNSKNGKKYIGSTNNFKRRFNQHINNLSKNKHPNKHLQSAWNIDGSDSFTFIKLLICEQKDLIMYEQSFLDFYKTYENINGYNLNPDAESNRGRIVSTETRKKMSIARQFVIISPETCQKISDGNKGKKVSLETKKLLREINSGRTFSEETLIKMSKAKLGKDVSDKHLEHLRTVNLGRKHSTETIEKAKLRRAITIKINKEKKQQQIFESNSVLDNTNFNV